MDGVLVIDKPRGPTSHDIVSQVRRALKEKKVGHTGTLDPDATGVLPLVLGRACKLARYLSGGDKTYEATVYLGATTSTLDGEGEILTRAPVEVNEAQVAAVLETFVGSISQVPPMYSAKKIEGKKLYELARQGIEVPREAKRVEVHRMRLIAFDGHELQLEVKCSAGTYVRVLAQDIGQSLGCGGYLKALRRTEAGPFSLLAAVSLATVVETPELAVAKILPLDHALGGLARLDVPADIGRMITSGYQLSVADLRSLDAPEFGEDEALAVGVDGGDVFAVARAQLASSELSGSRRDRRALKTERVLRLKP